ncbi:MAG: flagellar basal body P-ring protein FlgI [Gammaproteobacteria bacterium]|nr:flagellar basal body P-ring protein FlgI [Gammaproteobacteria bacterium]NNF61200.1 flagellar basal body P-ring protein FlgI [Gammaproteobacteria bacterium]NNM19949.1 flagellar basal body P-ring protein FlgI [Gammaproteobacteria bacterium]
MHRITLVFLFLAVLLQPVQAERIKDLASIAGVRNNQLVGYGLVVGLEGTGDQTSQAPFTVQSIKNFLQQFGITVPENVNPQLKNVAAVSIHADLPPFSKPGQSIDVTISSLGNAQSLRGGSLLMAPLRGADGEIYAMAQGSVIVSGFGASGNDGSRVTVNTTSAGRIPNGATVERSVPSNFVTLPAVFLNLNTPDFTTANRLTEAVNAMLGAGTAQALDPVSIKVAAPIDPSQRISFVSVLENIELEPGEAPARVIVNSRTGTVVIGSHVTVRPAAVSHGSLTVTITETPRASQPGAFSSGDTVVVNRSDIEIIEDAQRMFLFEPGVTLNEIVTAVNQVGAAPGDLVAILEALKQAGSLRAELIVI